MRLRIRLSGVRISSLWSLRWILSNASAICPLCESSYRYLAIYFYPSFSSNVGTMATGIWIFLSRHRRCIGRKAEESLAALERHAQKDCHWQLPISLILGLVDILVDKRVPNEKIFARLEREKLQSLVAQEKRRGEKDSEGSASLASTIWKHHWHPP